MRLKRIGDGRYESPTGWTVQRVDRTREEAAEIGLPSGTEWYITGPGEVSPDDVVDTLCEAREYIEAMEQYHEVQQDIIRPNV